MGGIRERMTQARAAARESCLACNAWAKRLATV